MRNRHILIFSCFSSISLFATVSGADAAFVFTASQSGQDVIVSGSGTLNTSNLALLGTTKDFAEIMGEGPIFLGGPTQPAPSEGYSGLSGPTNLGGGTPIPGQGAATGSGSIVGIVSGSLEVPNGYVSGTFLSNVDTYYAPSFASLDLAPGTYVYTWGSGPTADSLTINIGMVPEPASLAMLGVPAALALLRRRRGVV
jgi:hypothetical protein